MVKKLQKNSALNNVVWTLLYPLQDMYQTPADPLKYVSTFPNKEVSHTVQKLFLSWSKKKRSIGSKWTHEKLLAHLWGTVYQSLRFSRFELE